MEEIKLLELNEIKTKIDKFKDPQLESIEFFKEIKFKILRTIHLKEIELKRLRELLNSTESVLNLSKFDELTLITAVTQEPTTHLKDDILEYLRWKKEPRTRQQIQKHFKLSYNTINSFLIDLIKRDKIITIGKGALKTYIIK